MGYPYFRKPPYNIYIYIYILCKIARSRSTYATTHRYFAIYTFIWLFQGFFRANEGFFPRVFLGFLSGFCKQRKDYSRIPAEKSSITWSTKPCEPHQVKSSQHSGRPQSTVKVTKNDVPNNPKRIVGHSISAGHITGVFQFPIHEFILGTRNIAS